MVESQRRNARFVRLLVGCILVCFSFIAGLALGGNPSVQTMLGMQQSSQEDATAKPQESSTYQSLSARVGEVENFLSEDSLDHYDLEDATKLVLGSYLDASNDPYLHYYDADSYSLYLSNASNPESGVGVLFGEKDGKCYVVDVMEGSQAEAMGVQKGDEIESIDGARNDSWTLAEVVNTLNRNEDQDVFIEWVRPANGADESKKYGTTLKYGQTSGPNVTLSVRNGVAIIGVKQLSSNVSTLVADALKKAVKKNAQAIVLDLRDVPGGYLTQVVDVASLLVESAVVVQIQTKESTTSRTTEGHPVTDLPLVVLVNENTSGAAEVLAAALQESGRATLVGKTTQGKGTVQVMQPLSFGGALRYTAATYLTPSGKSLDGNGVSPDVAISDHREQVSVALEMARSEAN